MERQKSFSIRPGRLLFFSFTISSSLLFSFWVLTASSSVSSESSLLFSHGIHSFSAEGSLFSGRVQNPILVDVNLTGNGGISQKDEVFGDVKLSRAGNFGKDAILSDGSYGRRNTGNLLHSNSERNFDFSEKRLAEDSLVEVRKEKINASDVVGIGSFGNATTEKAAALIVGEIGKEGSICDVSDGRWVYDESYPLYGNNLCPFVDEGFNCVANGRLDRDYMKWRWQPNGCNLPRFDPVKMLELIRGKRLVFIGDSINRNQWESMLCMLRGAISDPGSVYEARRRRITKERGNYNFKFVDYRCSVEYYVTHFLVHESKAKVGQKRFKTLRIDAIDRGSSRWKGADILVFNTAHWWSHFKTEAGVNYYQEGNHVHPHLDVSTAFRKALMTWASWVDQHVDPLKTKVFFRSSSPSHFSGGEWNSGGHCKESTQPLNGTYRRCKTEKNMILEEIVKQMKTPVTILNITNISGLRIDGHPSIYGRRPGKGGPTSIQDCSHWCLPGVPDTWNELLYFHLQSRQRQVFTA